MLTGSLSLFFFFLTTRRPPLSTLFPYMTLFRSGRGHRRLGIARLLGVSVTRERGQAAAAGQRPVLTRAARAHVPQRGWLLGRDRKSTRLNSSHLGISYAVFCLKKKKRKKHIRTL